ncbi:hypothetical protein O0I10_001841 [Lichtheimia ornata]|uniref:Uncharacterized protein n=1 Tax=Lichtheimia ornata TaxID=688661 RepID=A0AAD7VA12_9FUNG|nr:uncharacterized protein O0I10_001841 [Lichtheimia ornata]KAJ8662148.1 hypothetical protein O0I10_001841 [Lichtheimia ornata]
MTQQQQQHHTSSHIVRPSSIAPTRVFISPIPTINTTVVLENDIKKRFCCQHYYASTIVSEQEEVEEQEEEEEEDEDEEDDSTTMTTTGGFSTHSESTMTTSPPISPPLSPSTSSRVSRLPRWIRQIGSMSNIKTPTNMPPWYEQEKEQKRLIDTCFRAAALYYEAPEVRQYLRKVTKRNRFDQMLLEGFPVMGNDGATDSGGVAGGARTMTLRLTLTPAHCRATDKEIYGKLSLSLPSPSHSSTTTPPPCSQTYSLPPPLPATIVSHHHHRHPPSLPPFVAGAPNNRMAFSPAAPDKLPNKINNITSLPPPPPPPLLVSTMSPPHLSPTRRSSSLPSSHQRRRILYEQQHLHQSPPILVLPPRKKQ